MKKIAFGAVLALTGTLFTGIFFANALLNPWDYHGISGILGSLLGTNTLFPALLCLAAVVAGLFICGYEAYRKDAPKGKEAAGEESEAAHEKE